MYWLRSGLLLRLNRRSEFDDLKFLRSGHVFTIKRPFELCRMFRGSLSISTGLCRLHELRCGGLFDVNRCVVCNMCGGHLAIRFWLHKLRCVRVWCVCSRCCGSVHCLCFRLLPTINWLL